MKIDRINFRLHKIALIIGVLALPIISACAPVPTEPVLVDSFFSARALIDVNANGQVDPADTPLENATFIITLQGGGEFGAQTDSSGNAFITVPSKVDYPVTIRMEAPKNSTLKPVEPSVITLNEAAGETPTTFLFSK